MPESEHNWNSLYKISGAAAAILLAYSLLTMVFLVVLGVQPQSAQEGFAMLQSNRLIGLLRLDVLTILVMPLYYLLALGLYVALKVAHAPFATLAALLVSAGVTLFLATPSALSWLALSDKFAAATSEVQKAQLLAAGEAILASDMWHGSGPFIGGLLLQTGMLFISVVMLRSQRFAKTTAYVGILTHGLDLTHLLAGTFFPSAGVIFMAIAGPLYLVWVPLLARDFFRLDHFDQKLHSGES